MSLVLARAWFVVVGAGSLFLCAGYLVGATQGNQISPLLFAYGIMVGCSALVLSMHRLMRLSFVSRAAALWICVVLAGSPFLWLVVIVATGAQSAAAYAVPPVLCSVAASLVFVRDFRRLR